MAFVIYYTILPKVLNSLAIRYQFSNLILTFAPLQKQESLTQLLIRKYLYGKDFLYENR